MEITKKRSQLNNKIIFFHQGLQKKQYLRLITFSISQLPIISVLKFTRYFIIKALEFY